MARLLPSRKFGPSGITVTRVGLGGEGVLRTYDKAEQAEEVIAAAAASGITYFDTARVYSDSEKYLGAYWTKNPDERKSFFQTSKSASRDKDGAQADLESTLKRLNTSYLDLWQIHDLRTEQDFKAIERAGGALEAFIDAKKTGVVRYIGVTGHHDPYILTRAVQEWPVDAVLMPVNPVEAVLGGFMTHTMEAARQKNIAVIGMKVLGASHYILPKFFITADLLIRFALSYDIEVAIVGCSDQLEVKTLVQACNAASHQLSAEERNRIIKIFTPFAQRLAFYRGVG